MSNILFHNRLHRTIHHTVSSATYPDSHLDPVASEDKPFFGIFYNTIPAGSHVLSNYLTDFSGNLLLAFNLDEIQSIAQTSNITVTDSIATNSQQWSNAYAIAHALSAEFGQYLTVFNTVTALSGQWKSAADFFVNFFATSAGFISCESTVRTLSVTWEEYPFKHLVNLAQADTQAKNFAATKLPVTSNLVWDLSANQFSYMTLTSSVVFKNLDSIKKKKGGQYYLMLKQPASGSNDVYFDSDFVFSNFDYLTGDTVNKEPLGVTVFKFVTDGVKMYARTEIYTLSGLTPYTYFAGPGIIIDDGINIAEAFETEEFDSDNGLIIAGGGVPYSGTTGIDIV